MNWIVAVSAGAGLGLVYFGGLWMTVIGVVRRPSRAAWVPVSGLARLILLGLGLSILSRQGAGSILAALGGLWWSRWYLVRRLGGIRHGE
jgi:F1F0 ATPase subunit 2